MSAQYRIVYRRRDGSYWLGRPGDWALTTWALRARLRVWRAWPEIWSQPVAVIPDETAC